MILYMYVSIITYYFDQSLAKVLDLSGNSISSLKGLESLPFLYDINLEENEVRTMYRYVLCTISSTCSSLCTYIYTLCTCRT